MLVTRPLHGKLIALVMELTFLADYQWSFGTHF